MWKWDRVKWPSQSTNKFSTQQHEINIFKNCISWMIRSFSISIVFVMLSEKVRDKKSMWIIHSCCFIINIKILQLSSILPVDTGQLKVTDASEGSIMLIHWGMLRITVKASDQIHVGEFKRRTGIWYADYFGLTILGHACFRLRQVFLHSPFASESLNTFLCRAPLARIPRRPSNCSFVSSGKYGSRGELSLVSDSFICTTIAV